jgi:hypothetical protein
LLSRTLQLVVQPHSNAHRQLAAASLRHDLLSLHWNSAFSGFFHARLAWLLLLSCASAAKQAPMRRLGLTQLLHMSQTDIPDRKTCIPLCAAKPTNGRDWQRKSLCAGAPIVPPR